MFRISPEGCSMRDEDGPSSSAHAYSLDSGPEQVFRLDFSTVPDIHDGTTKPDIVAHHAKDPREERARCTRGFGRRQFGWSWRDMRRPRDKKEGVQFEIGVAGGVHLFNKNLELGVADDPTLTSPKNAPLFGLRLGLLLHPMFAHRGRRRRDPDQGARHGRERLHHRRARIARLQHHARADRRRQVRSRSCSRAPACERRVHGRRRQLHGDQEGHRLRVSRRRRARSTTSPTSSTCGWTRAPSACPTPDSKSYSLDWEFMAGVGFTLRRHGALPPPPPPPLIKDSDNDGIPDDADKCPNEAGPKDNNGCPDKDTRRRRRRRSQGQVPRQGRPGSSATAAPKRTRTTTASSTTRTSAPTSPRTRTSFEDEDGCPDPDNDKDGVLDENDKCPTEPETKNGYQDDDGCPDEVPAAVKKFTGVVKGINFRRNSADIKPSSFPLLKEAVERVQGVPGRCGSRSPATPPTRASATST